MSAASDKGGLRRTLGPFLLILYGLGTVIGAGIYVLIGAVADTAGMAAPLSFLLAGGFAALTGLSYAELCVRYPEAAGASAYVGHAFKSALAARVTGLLVALVAMVAAASIASGVSGYAAHAFDIPGPLAGGILVVFFTGVACLAVRQSVGFSAVLTVIEITGLVIVVAVAAPGAFASLIPDGGAPVHQLNELVPADLDAWQGVIGGMFLAYFAFLGFESMANMAGEARDSERTLPFSIIATLIISAGLYALVVLVCVLSVSPGDLAVSKAPLSLVVERSLGGYGQLFSIFAVLATVNGVLIDILMLSRLMYGMACHGWLPKWLSRVNGKTQNPVRAVLVAGFLVLAMTVILPFTALVALTSALTLIVFMAVNLSLARLHFESDGVRAAFCLPRALPPLGAAACLALLIAELFL